MKFLKTIKKPVFEFIANADILEILTHPMHDKVTCIFEHLDITIELQDNHYGIPNIIKFEQMIQLSKPKYYKCPIATGDKLPVIVKAYKIKKTEIKNQYLCHICLELFVDCNSSMIFLPVYHSIILTSNLAMWNAKLI